MQAETSTSRKRSDSAAGYAVRRIGTEEAELWDSFVRQSPQGRLFHKVKWLQSIGRPFHIYGCFQRASLVAGMVLIEDPPHVAMSRYHLAPYLGVILPPALPKYLTNLTRYRDVMTELANFAKKHFKVIHSHMVPEVVDVLPFIWAGYSTHVTYTYRIDLTDLDQAWRNMEDKRRNDIRRAERDKITVDESASVQDILGLADKTYQRQEKEVHFSELARQIERALLPENQCRCFLARDKDSTPLAGIFMLWDDKDAYYFLGGYDSKGYRGAGALAIWHAIRYAATKLQLQYFDFLGSHVIKLERFFRDFGGVWTPTYNVSWERNPFLSDLRRLLRGSKNSVIESIGSRLPRSSIAQQPEPADKIN
jgi:Acetyltransferase (GNAT) domain